MKAEFYQDERALGESGLTETDFLILSLDGIMVKTFDEYYYLHSFPDDMLWSPSRRRICFVANKYPEGTFPANDMNLERYSATPLVLCVFDVYDREVVKEIPLPGDPGRISWNTQEDLPEAVQESIEFKSRTVSEVKDEYDSAREYMNRAGTIKPEDPINDPTRLEYWLFYYDPRYVKGTPFEYASRMRDKYLKEHNLQAPYESSPETTPHFSVDWDTSRPFTRSQALEEIMKAQDHVFSSGDKITKDDPIYNPARLEYYMFEYNPNVSTENVTEYAIRRRNEFLNVHGIPVPYEKEILRSSGPRADAQISRANTGPTHLKSGVRPEVRRSESPVQSRPGGGKPKESLRRRNNAWVIVLSVAAAVLSISLAVLLFRSGETRTAGLIGSIPLFIIFSVIFRITRNYQARIPGRYNLWRVILGFFLLFSSATYQIAKLVNNQVGYICGGVEYPSWTFLGASVLLIALWIAAAKKKNQYLNLDLVDDAKRWGWVIPVCITLILGFFLYAAMALK